MALPRIIRSIIAAAVTLGGIFGLIVDGPDVLASVGGWIKAMLTPDIAYWLFIVLGLTSLVWINLSDEYRRRLSSWIGLQPGSLHFWRTGGPAANTAENKDARADVASLAVALKLRDDADFLENLSAYIPSDLSTEEYFDIGPNQHHRTSRLTEIVYQAVLNISMDLRNHGIQSEILKVLEEEERRIRADRLGSECFLSEQFESSAEKEHFRIATAKLVRLRREIKKMTEDRREHALIIIKSLALYAPKDI